MPAVADLEDRDWVPDEHHSDNEEAGEEEEGEDGSDDEDEDGEGDEEGGDGSADAATDVEDAGLAASSESEAEEEDEDGDGDDDGEDPTGSLPGLATISSAAAILGGADDEDDDEDDEYVPSAPTSPVRGSPRPSGAERLGSGRGSGAAAQRSTPPRRTPPATSTPGRTTRSRAASPAAPISGSAGGRGASGGQRSARRALRSAGTPPRASPGGAVRVLTPSRRDLSEAVSDPDAAIAKRTRAHYSLAEQQLEELEALLHNDSPPGSPRARGAAQLAGDAPAACGEDDSEWSRFLLEIRDEPLLRGGPGDAGAGRVAGARGRGCAASAGAARGVGVGAGRGAGVGGGEASGSAAVEEEEEEDDRDYSYLADSFGRDESEEDSDEEWDEEPMGDITMDEVRELLRDTATSRHSARRGGVSSAATGAASNGAGASGGAGGRGVAPAGLFTPRQAFHLQVQLHVHMQLLVQCMLLARKAIEIEPSYLKVAMLPYGLLAELCTYCDITAAYKQLRRRPTYATPLRPLTHAAAGEEEAGPAADAPPSILAVPGLPALAELLLSQPLGLKRLYDAPDARMRQVLAREMADRAGEEEGFRLDVEMRRLLPHFNKSYLPRREQATSRSPFCAAEDHLLALGLRRYGLGRFDLIRAHLLPSKSVEALHMRYTSKTSRRASDNPVRRAKAECVAASLTAAEETALVSAVRRYGEDWPLIRARVLRHRSESQLREAWVFRLRPGAMEAPLPLPEAPTVFGQVYSAAAAAAAAAASAAAASISPAVPSTLSSMPPPPPRPPRATGAGSVPASPRAAGPPALGVGTAARPCRSQVASAAQGALAVMNVGNGTGHVGFAVDELSSSDDDDGNDGGDYNDGGHGNDGSDDSDGGMAPQQSRPRGAGETSAGHGGLGVDAGVGNGGGDYAGGGHGGGSYGGGGHGSFAVDELSSSDGDGEEDEEATQVVEHLARPLGAAGAVPKILRSVEAAPANVPGALTPAAAAVQPVVFPAQSNTAAGSVPVASPALIAPIRPGDLPTDAGDRAIQAAMQRCGGDAVQARDSLLAAGTIHFSYTTNALRARCQQLSSDAVQERG
jgi:hypothetical protein